MLPSSDLSDWPASRGPAAAGHQHRAGGISLTVVWNCSGDGGTTSPSVLADEVDSRGLCGIKTLGASGMDEIQSEARFS